MFDDHAELTAQKRVVSDTLVFILGTLVLLSACFSRPCAAQENPVFRSPFVLKIRIDSGHYYEEKFDKVPYVADNEVYLFAGENFGINVTIVENEISQITYQRDPTKANVNFTFTQKESPSGLMMLLLIRNKLKRSLLLDAKMTVPGQKGIYKTSVLPVKAGLSNVESWPHPIVQLVLGNLRFSEDEAKPGER
jgi:hypothetical protein